MNAKDILVRAVECDKAERYMEAQGYYKLAIEMLLNLVANEADAEKKAQFFLHIKKHIERAEKIKAHLQTLMLGESVAHISIDENDTGYSYDKLFGSYLDEQVLELTIEEPYLDKNHQFHNFIRFLEVVVKRCANLRFVLLVTKPMTLEQQVTMFEGIKSDLKRRNIRLSVEFEDTLHDRKIILSNGYVIKVGRGLDIFKAPSPLFSLGLGDYEFRKCRQTEIDVRYKQLPKLSDVS